MKRKKTLKNKIQKLSATFLVTILFSVVGVAVQQPSVMPAHNDFRAWPASLQAKYIQFLHKSLLRMESRQNQNGVEFAVQGSLFAEAFAAPVAEGSPCLFAGHFSTVVRKGQRLTCERPKDVGCTGEGVKCSGVLTGSKEVCVPPSKFRNATAYCRSQAKSAEVAVWLATDAGKTAFNDTKQKVDGFCNDNTPAFQVSTCEQMKIQLAQFQAQAGTVPAPSAATAACKDPFDGKGSKIECLLDAENTKLRMLVAEMSECVGGPDAKDGDKELYQALAFLMADDRCTIPSVSTRPQSSAQNAWQNLKSAQQCPIRVDYGHTYTKEEAQVSLRMRPVSLREGATNLWRSREVMNIKDFKWFNDGKPPTLQQWLDGWQSSKGQQKGLIQFARENGICKNEPRRVSTAAAAAPAPAAAQVAPPARRPVARPPAARPAAAAPPPAAAARPPAEPAAPAGVTGDTPQRPPRAGTAK